jgi:hypothetical protein
MHRLRREFDETMTRTSQQVEAERTEKEVERLAKEKLESVIANSSTIKIFSSGRQRVSKGRRKLENNIDKKPRILSTNSLRKRNKESVKDKSGSKLRGNRGFKSVRGRISGAESLRPRKFLNLHTSMDNRSSQFQTVPSLTRTAPVSALSDQCSS